MTEQIQMERFTNEALAALEQLAMTSPELWDDPNTDFLAELRQRNVRPATEPNGLYANQTPTMPRPETGARRRQAAAAALEFYNNIPGLNPRTISDPNFLSWLSCVHLHQFGLRRWPPRDDSNRTTWINIHYLPRRGREITNGSLAGRTCWLAQLSNTVAQEIPALTAAQVLNHFAERPEHYHYCTGYELLRSPATLAQYVLALVTQAQGINRKGAQELARDLNRLAGARVVSALSQAQLKEHTESLVDRIMRHPRFVRSRDKLRGTRPLQVLSLGGGVQSTVMALMADIGYEGLEKPDFAIFADTGWEPEPVYQHLKWLEAQLSFPVYHVGEHNIRTHILSGINPEGRNFIDMPIYLTNPDGSQGIAKRQCTRIFKMDPIYRFLSDHLKLEPKRPAPVDVMVEMWLGISRDEISRTRNGSRKPWIENRYPLVERDLSRTQLYDWFSRRYPGRPLPKSACIGCPYHTDHLWAEMKRNDPKSFEDAKHIDYALRNDPTTRGSLNGTAFLHRSRIPLSEVNFDETVTETDLMQQECEGLCQI